MNALDIENDTQKRHIQELEQFVVLMSSALTQERHAGGAGMPNETNLIKMVANQFNLNIKQDQ